MPKTKSTSFASTSNTSTKWLQNALRSIGVSTKNVLKNNFAPNIYEVVSNGAKTSRTIVTNLRRNASRNNLVQKQLTNNKYVKYAKDAYKNALYDLKTGNFNNEQRTDDSFFGDMGGFSDIDSMFDSDDGFSFGDDGVNDIDVNVVGSSVGNNDAMFALSTQLQKNAEATLKTNQANMDAMIAINSASMMQIQQLGSDILGGINSINENLAALIEFNNTNMTNFVSSSLAFFERMGTKFDGEDSYSSGNEKIKATDILNNNSGGINVSSYKDYVKQQLKGLSDSGAVGLVKSIVSDDTMMKMLVSNPIGFVSEGMVKYMAPSILVNSIKGAEKAFSSFMPALLSKMGEWGDSNPIDLKGNVKKIFGQIFGIKTKRIEEFKKGSAIEKGPVPFDGITRQAITEVITKELREQTAYLKAIADHYKIDTESARKSARIFDYKTGTYTNETEITNNIVEEIRNSTVQSMADGRFGKELKRSKHGLREEKDKEIYESLIEQLLYRIERNGKSVELSEKAFNDETSDYRRIMSELKGGSEGLKKYLDQYIQDMVKNNPLAAMDLERSRLVASNERNRAISEIQNNASEYNLFAATEFDNRYIDDIILDSFNTPSGGNGKKEKGARGKFFKKDNFFRNSGYYNGKEKYKFKRYKKYSDEDNARMIKAAHKYDGDLDDDDKASFLERFRKNHSNGDNGFDSYMQSVGKAISGSLMGILNRNADEAFNSLKNVVVERSKKLFDDFSNNFLIPIKESIFGTKDEESGFSKNGIFSSITNSFKDTANMIRYQITGKGFEASDGTIYDDKRDDEETVIGNLKKIGTNIKNGVLEKLFGKKVYDENGNLIEDGEGGIVGKGKGILSGFGDSIKQGLVGWQEALFGKKLTDEEKKDLKKSMEKNLNERMPSTLTGSAVGVGVGMMSGSSLLGFLFGGPIGGAAMGAAVGFASKSEKFQNMLFGEKDENGERLGGLINKKTQDFFKKNKGAIIGGGTIGAITKGGLLGKTVTGGLLANLVGGPIAGAMIGMATTMVIKSNTFQEFLFGDPKTGQKGIIESFKSVFSRKGKNGEEITSAGKMFGMSILGAGAGALTGSIISKMGLLGATLMPYGPIGGAVLGLGASIIAQKDNFLKWLFGEKDENGNKTKEGILGQFANMLKVTVVHPLADSMANFAEDVAYQVKFNILDPIRYAVEPIGEGIKKIGSTIKNSVTGIFNTIGESVDANIIQPIGDLIFTPIRSAIQGLTKAIWGVTKNIVTAPFKLLNKITGFIVSPIRKAISSINDKIHEKILDPIAEKVKKVTKTVFGLITGTIKGLATVFIKYPFELIGGFGTYIGDKLSNVGGADKKVEDAGGIRDDQYEQRKLRKKQAKVERDNKRKHRRERAARTRNEQIIARATNYQFTEDTEENRERARAAGYGRKLNTRIEAMTPKAEIGSTNGMSEHDILNSNFNELNEGGRQTNLLVKIKDFVGKISNTLKRKNGSTNDEDNDDIQDSSNSDNETKSHNENDEDDDDSTPKLSNNERIAAEIEAAGGIRKYISSNISGFFGSVKEGYEGSYLQGKVDQVKGLLGRFRGRGFAKGTENAPKDEAVMVGEQGPELMIPKGGEKIYANSKPLSVYIVGMTPAVTDIFKSNEPAPDENEKTDGSYADASDVVQDSNAIMKADMMSNGEGDGGAQLANAIAASDSAHAMDGNDNDSQEAKEDDRHQTVLQGLASIAQKKALDKAKTAEELKKEKQEEEERAKMSALVKNTGEQVKEQKGFSDLWSSIFSKKGLLTGLALVGIPLLINFLKNTPISSILSGIFDAVKNIVGSIGSFVGNLFEDAAWTEKNGARADSKSAIEAATDAKDRLLQFPLLSPLLNAFGIDTTVSESYDGDFIMNEDNQWDSQSGDNARLLMKSIFKVPSLVKGFKGMAKSDGVFKTLGSLFTKKGRKTIINRGANGLIQDGVDKGIKIGGKKAAEEGAEAAAKEAGKKVGKEIVEEATEKGAKTALENNTDPIISKVLEHIKSFFDTIIKRFEEKAGEKVGNALEKLTSKIPECVKKKASAIAEAVGPILAEAGALATTVVGYLGKESTWAAFGAANGAWSASKLFKIPSGEYDEKMVIISTIIGALEGTTPGTIVAIVNDIIAGIIGCDIISEAATLLYNKWAGEEKAHILKNNQIILKNDYLEYQEKQILQEYEVQKKVGVIDESVTEGEFVAGVRDGTYNAHHDSFEDYNAEVNGTMADKAWEGVFTGGKSVYDFIKSEKTTTKTDSRGFKYTNNHDGTWQVTSPDGEDLGPMSEDAIPEDAVVSGQESTGMMKVGEFIGDKAKGAGKGIGNFFVGGSTNTTAFLMPDGSYYDTEGNYYDKKGNLIEKNVYTINELSNLASAGSLTMKENFQVQKSGLSIAYNNTLGTFVDNNKLIGQAIGDKAIEAGKGIGNFFVGGGKETAYLANDGSYYDTNGTHYDKNGNILKENAYDINELSDMLSDGTLTVQENFQVQKSEISKGFNNVKDTLMNGWDGLKSSVSETVGNIGNEFNKAWDSAKETVSSAWDGITTFWGNTFDNMGKGISSAWDGVVNTFGNIFGGLGDKIGSLWDSAKETVSSAWDGITTFWGNTFDNMGKGISSAWDGVVNTFGDIFGGIGDKIGSLWDSAKETVSGAFESIGNWFGEKFEGIKNGVSDAVSGVTDWVGDRFNDVKNGASTAINWAGDRLNDAKNGASTAINWAGDRLNDAKNWAGDRLNDIKGFLGFAKGTENAPKDEAVMVGEEGPELMVTKGGEKIYANSKPLQVVLGGMTSNVENAFNSLNGNSLESMSNSIASLTSKLEKNNSIIEKYPNINKNMLKLVNKMASKKINASDFDDFGSEEDSSIFGNIKSKASNFLGNVKSNAMNFLGDAKSKVENFLGFGNDNNTETKEDSGFNLFDDIKSKVKNFLGFGDNNNSSENTNTDFFDNIKSKITEKVSPIIDKAKEFKSNITDKLTSFLGLSSNKGWRDPDGGYYVSNGKGYSYYNANGEMLIENVENPEEISKNIENGAYVSFDLKSDNESKLDNAKNIIESFGDKMLTRFTDAVSGTEENFDSTQEVGEQFFEDIQENGIVGSINGVFNKLTQNKVWFDATGNYYKLSGNKNYDYYNINGDLISKNIPEKEIKDKIQTGLLTIANIPKSNASSTISKIVSSAQKLWSTSRSTVTNGLSKIASSLASTTSYTLSNSGTRTSSSSTSSGSSHPFTKSAFTTDDETAESDSSVSDNATNIGDTAANIVNNVTGGSGYGVPYYSQNDSRWSKNLYGNDGATIGDTGCGPTSMAMVASSLTGQVIKPQEMANLSKVSGMRDETGTNAKFIGLSAQKYGLKNTEVVSPTADSIYNAVSNGPTILLGQSKNKNTPYTSAGHYVVADGIDSNGFVDIKDPRGRSYNRKYNIKDLVNSTGSLWSFGGKGNGSKRRGRRKIKDGRGYDRSKWISIIQEVKKQYVEKAGYYSQGDFVSVVINGETQKCRLDCSGFVWACLHFFGATDEINLTCNAKWMGENAEKMQETGFKSYKWPGSWDKIGVGDIMVDTSCHVKIFAGLDDDGCPTVWHQSDDGVSAANVNPVKTDSSPFNKSCQLFWSPDGVEGNGVSSSSSSSGTSSSSSIFDTITAFFGEFINKSMDGVMTGDYDTNYVFNKPVDTGTIATTSTTLSSGTVSGNSNAEKIWNYLISAGFTPIAAAGIMGNFQQESSCDPNACESDSDWTGYTSKLDNGTISRDTFINTYSGYGLAQWTVSDRKSNFYDFVKSRNTSFGDIGTQLDFVIKEMGSYDGLISKLNNSTSISDSTLTFHNIYEGSADTASMLQGRVNYGTEYYNKFNGGSGFGRRLRGGFGPGIPYYSQTDSRWANKAYGNDGATMGDTGCGPTSMAMVASSLTGRDIDPLEMANLAQSSGMRDITGTNANFINMSANAYGLNSSELMAPSAKTLYDSASRGPTVLLGRSSSGAYTPYGHYIVTDGVDSRGNIKIKDPRGLAYNKKYNANDLAKYTGNMWSFGGHGELEIYALPDGTICRGVDPNKYTYLGKYKTNSYVFGRIENGKQIYYYYDKTEGLRPMLSFEKEYYLSHKSKYSSSSNSNNALLSSIGSAVSNAGLRTAISNVAGSIAGAMTGALDDDDDETKSTSSSASSGSSATSNAENRARWLSIVKEVKKQYAEKGGRYDQGGFITVKIGDKTKTDCRLDCSGYVWTCLYMFGVDDGSSKTCNQRWMGPNAEAMKKTGFTYYSWPGSWDKVGVGDIMVGPEGGDAIEHTQIFAGVENGQPMVYSIGSDSQASTPDPTPESHDKYAIFWSPDGSCGTGYDGSGQSTSIFDTITAFYSEFTNKAMDGMLTGDYDTNYVFNKTTKTGVTSTTTIGTGGSLTGSSDEEKIYNYLTSAGFSPTAVAGIMGNFKQESGLRSNNVGDDVNANTGYSDEEFTAAVDNGTISEDEFVNGKLGSWGDGAYGYGLAQWTAAERKKQLYDLAKSKNVSIGDLAMQLEFLLNELKNYDSDFISTLNNKSTASDAARYFHDNIERSADTEAMLQAGRLKYATEIYNQYNGGSGFGFRPNIKRNLFGGNGIGTNMQSRSRTSIYKPNIVSNTHVTRVKGGRGSIKSTDVLSSVNMNKDYTNATVAQKYISDTSSNGMNKALNLVIAYLDAITNNTAVASDKLNALNELKNLSNGNSPVLINTTNNNTNVTAGNSTKKSSQTVTKSNSNNRNLNLAEKIARG